MTNTQYSYGFDQCQTEEEVKTRLRNLAKLLHPDHNGDPILFANCKAEAETRIAELRNPHKEQSRQNQYRQTQSARQQRPAHQHNPLGDIATVLIQDEDVQKAIIGSLMGKIPANMRKAVKTIATCIAQQK